MKYFLKGIFICVLFLILLPFIVVTVVITVIKIAGGYDPHDAPWFDKLFRKLMWNE